MRIRIILPWLIAAAALWGLPARAQTTITASGSAAILNGDLAHAKDRAVESALRTAVEQVVGTMVDSESLVQNNQLLSDKIYTQTTGYIASYNITGEKPDRDNNIYTVSVEAQVKEGSLQDDLQATGVLLHRMHMPRVAVALHEEGDAASNQVMRLLKDKGFLVVDTGSKEPPPGFFSMNENQRADLMKKYGAEVVILGSASAQAGGNIGSSGMKSYQGQVSLKALKTDTKEALGASSGSAAVPHIGEAGAMEALKQAAAQAGNDLIRQITSQWAKETSSTRMLTLEVKGMGPADAEAFAKKLKQQGRGVQDVVVRDAAGSSATFGVSMQGDASALAQEVVKVYPRLRIVEKTANRLTVSK